MTAKQVLDRVGYAAKQTAEGVGQPLLAQQTDVFLRTVPNPN
jgi:hypothetical protein